MTRYDAFVELLAQPDLPDLPHRSRHYTCARHQDGACGPTCGRTFIDEQGRTVVRSSDPWEIKRDLGIAYVERMRQEWTDGDISCVVSVRRTPLYAIRRRA